MNFNDAHVKLRRDPVERVTLGERVVGGRGIGVPAFFEIVFTQVAVDAVLIAPLAVGIEVFHHGIGAVKIREALADDPEGVVYTLPFLIVLGLGKIVSRRHLTIQECNEPMQGILIELLLVEGPAELVQGELVVRRLDTPIHDALVGCFRIEITPADKEEFGPPEPHLVDVAGLREIADHPVHDPHGILCLPQFLVGTGHLVQDLVVPLVKGVFVQQLLVELDRLPSPCFFQLFSTGFGKPARFFSPGGKLRTLGRPFFEVRLRLGLGRLRGLVRTGRRKLRALGTFGGRQRSCRGPSLGCRRVSEISVFLLDLQVGKTTHRRGSERRFGGIVQKALVTHHGFLEPPLDPLFLDLDLHVPQLGNRLPAAARLTCGKDRRNC